MKFPIEQKFKLSESFLEKYKTIKPDFGFGGLGEFVYMRCVSIETPVLCSNFVWKNAGDLVEGDKLLAFTEEPVTKNNERLLCLSHVTHNEIEEAECLGIELENGEILYCTPEHRWIAKTSHGLQWVMAKDLAEGMRGANIYLPKFIDVTMCDNSYESGYLSAAFDGEASLDKNNGLNFVQTENQMLEKTKDCLDTLGFKYVVKPKKSYISNTSFKTGKEMFSIKMYGKDELFKFFSKTHPKRLESKFIDNLDKFNLTLRTSRHIKVVNVFNAGIRKIAVLSTSSKTHITAGYPSHNTYSRLKSDGKNEMWWETVQRVVEGIYSIQKQHIEDYSLGWNQAKAQKSSQEMYDRIFNFKMLGSGRALWAMGSPVIMEKGLTAALYNCSFISTENIADNPGLPFKNAMDFLMLGVGVGSDTRGAGKIVVKEQKDKEHLYVIPDTREGWIESIQMLINSYFGYPKYEFDYSEIRPAGMPIKTFGGVSAGSKPLEELHSGISQTLSKNIGKEISSRSITDIMNMIGRAVVSGNVRRSAEIILGEATEEFLDLKNYEKNPDRMEYGWASNNSVFSELGDNYTEISKRIASNGEPGILWLSNMRKYGRMRETEANWKDRRLSGVNPCAEIGLESSELCNLVETFPTRHKDLDDYKQTLKYAYLFAKTVTLLNTNWSETNKVMLRNRRIGLSMTGITMFIAEHGMEEMKKWMEQGYDTIEKYDKTYSEWFAVPLSIKFTTAKPSGTLSLLVGVTPGVHFPESQSYIRRVRLSNNSPFVEVLKNANYKVEPANEDVNGTVVVEFPVHLGDKIRTTNDVSMWEQLNLAAFVQENWSDNAVSVTITFKENEAKDIKNALDIFQFKLKSVSFLPKLEIGGAYKQMPYEEITKEQFLEMSKNILPLDFSSMFSLESVGEQYCSNDSCSF